MHAIWEMMLYKEFMDAYESGIVICFADGVRRWVFPRIFTYSADYPEKWVYSNSKNNCKLILTFNRVLLSTIKSLGGCPCPRCLVQKDKIGKLGTLADRKTRKNLKTVQTDSIQRQKRVELTRRWIFEKGMGIGSARVEGILKKRSEVPTRVCIEQTLHRFLILVYLQNAFSTRFSKYGYNFHSMFVPNLLHEFEIGVWKAVFTHLKNLLSSRLLISLRYRAVPTFGTTIRKFSNNASGMKKLAARNFEDLLQVSQDSPSRSVEKNTS